MKDKWLLAKYWPDNKQARSEFLYCSNWPVIDQNLITNRQEVNFLTTVIDHLLTKPDNKQVEK